MRRPFCLTTILLLAACSAESSTSAYFRLDRVDSTTVPADLGTNPCCAMILDSGSVHIASEAQIDRTLHFTAYTRNPDGSITGLNTTTMLYAGTYATVDSMLIITYPAGVGIGGADTAIVRHDGLTIVLRPSGSWQRHLLHYTATNRFCDPLSEWCQRD
jgi:hypothetical protein